MARYEIGTYGDRVADYYDRLYPDTAPGMVGRLMELAGEGRVLELGIGTGRVALPMHDLGIEVQGIDASNAMVAELRAKPGGDEIAVAIGDFADVAVGGRFSLVFVVFNTFFGLLSQEEQVRCFRNVAQHLEPDGVFLIEAFVPDLTRFTRGQSVSAVDIETDSFELDVGRLDAVRQVVKSQHLIMSGDQARLLPVQIRFAWPSELDLMAKLAGLELLDRWAGWDKEPFKDDSKFHVSVYARGQPM